MGSSTVRNAVGAGRTGGTHRDDEPSICAGARRARQVGNDNVGRVDEAGRAWETGGVGVRCHGFHVECRVALCRAREIKMFDATRTLFPMMGDGPMG